MNKLDNYVSKVLNKKEVDLNKEEDSNVINNY